MSADVCTPLPKIRRRRQSTQSLSSKCYQQSQAPASSSDQPERFVAVSVSAPVVCLLSVDRLPSEGSNKRSSSHSPSPSFHQPSQHPWSTVAPLSSLSIYLSKIDLPDLQPKVKKQLSPSTAAPTRSSGGSASPSSRSNTPPDILPSARTSSPRLPPRRPASPPPSGGPMPGFVHLEGQHHPGGGGEGGGDSFSSSSRSGLRDGVGRLVNGLERMGLGGGGLTYKSGGGR